MAVGGSQAGSSARGVAPAPAAPPASPNKALLEILTVSCRVVAKCGISKIFLEKVCSLVDLFMLSSLTDKKGDLVSETAANEL